METLIWFGIIVSLVVTVLLVRFLWMLPNELRDINKTLKYFVFLSDRDDDTDDVD